MQGYFERIFNNGVNDGDFTITSCDGEIIKCHLIVLRAVCAYGQRIKSFEDTWPYRTKVIQVLLTRLYGGGLNVANMSYSKISELFQLMNFLKLHEKHQIMLEALQSWDTKTSILTYAIHLKYHNLKIHNFLKWQPNENLNIFPATKTTKDSKDYCNILVNKTRGQYIYLPDTDTEKVIKKVHTFLCERGMWHQDDIIMHQYVKSKQAILEIIKMYDISFVLEERDKLGF